MPESNYVFESGEPIVEGSHGDHDYVFSSGEPVLDGGQSPYVFESGTGLRGGGVFMEGTQVGVFETNETHAEFYDYTTGSDSPPNARGLDEFGIDDIDDHSIYVFVHYDTGNDSYALGMWAYDAVDPNDKAEGGVRTINTPSDLSWTEEQRDDPPEESSVDEFSVNDPDFTAKFAYNIEVGDGWILSFPKGAYEFSLEGFNPNLGFASGRPVSWRGRGPEGNVTTSYSDGSTFSITIAV